jgi:hypothetical protein
MECNFQPIGVQQLVPKRIRLPLRFLCLLGTWWFTMPPHALAQTPVGCNTGWGTIPAMTGTFSVSGSGSGSSSDQFGQTQTWSTNQHMTGSIKMAASGLPIGNGGTCYLGMWNGSVTQSIDVDDVHTFTNTNGNLEKTELVVTQGQSIPSGNPPSLVVFPLNGTFKLDIASFTGADTGLVNATEISTDAGVVSTGQTQILWGPTTSSAVPPIGTFLTGALPTTVGPISGSVTFQAPAADGSTMGNTITWTITWNFVPGGTTFDLIVSIPAYATWRPTAGRTEKDTGTDPSTGQPNTLEIDTQLIDKATGQTAYPDSLTFSLVEDSTEPGVTLNWPPPTSATSDPDLTFDPTLNFLATVSPDGKTAVLTTPKQAFLAYTNAILSPHDWGAWATLNVTATINGQTITGHFNDGSNTTDILIPKRQSASQHVADVWKTQHNVALSTPDDDDSEMDPSGYPGCVGDGFTLYEEYRGFMENGKHIEGDPNKKDYFVENLIGADAEPGISFFTELTGLNIHKDILRAETKIDHPNGAFGSILINFNHSQGAHVTDQHGVTIVTLDLIPGGDPFRPLRDRLDGGLTIPVAGSDGFHLKPRMVDGIAMQPRDVPGSLLNPGNTHGTDITPGVITPTAAFIQYDVGVAHELLHSVGVDHHGDGDAVGPAYFDFLLPDDPRNTTGQASYVIFDPSDRSHTPVTLLPEQGGADLATTQWQKYEEDYKLCLAVEAAPGIYPPSWVTICDSFLFNVRFSVGYASSIRLMVGHPHREFSGNDQCVMRYFFAQVYPSASASDTYYLVPAGTEPLGSMICDSAAGTGVNDPNRKPQARYFDAAPGRGGCQFWICVSDNKNYPLVPN